MRKDVDSRSPYVGHRDETTDGPRWPRWLEAMGAVGIVALLLVVALAVIGLVMLGRP